MCDDEQHINTQRVKLVIFFFFNACMQFHFSLARFAAGDNGCEIREPAHALRSGLVSSETAYQTVGLTLIRSLSLFFFLLLCRFVRHYIPVTFPRVNSSGLSVSKGRLAH